MGNEIGIGAVGKMELHRQAARAGQCIDQLRGRNVGISLRKTMPIMPQEQDECIA